MEIIIRLNRMEFHAPIGWYAEEQLLGSTITSDIELKVNVQEVEEDELSHTVNYELIYDLAKAIIMRRTKLLETVADKIATAILSSYAEVKEVKVIISKMNPPLGGKAESVSVEVKKKN